MVEGESNPYPSFCAMISAPLTQRLEVPSLFMTRHGDRFLGDDVLLIDRVGDTWEAKLSRTTRGTWLSQMTEFGDHYSVQPGDMMMFQLVGYCQLLVSVFGHDGMQVAAGPRD